MQKTENFTLSVCRKTFHHTVERYSLGGGARGCARRRVSEANRRKAAALRPEMGRARLYNKLLAAMLP